MPPPPRHYMLVLSFPALLCDHFNSLVLSLAVTPFLSPFFRISLSSPALFSSVSERSFLSQLCTKAVWWRGWLQANTRPLSPWLSQWAAFAVTHPAHPRTTLILPHLILLFFFYSHFYTFVLWEAVQCAISQMLTCLSSHTQQQKHLRGESWAPPGFCSWCVRSSLELECERRAKGRV